MSRIVYVNGRYEPYAEAGVHVEDRGNQFGDAVYEVCEINQGRIVDEPRHMARLQRSLGEVRIRLPMSMAALGRVIRETIRRNRVKNGFFYLQVSRGAAPRDFHFPDPEIEPTVICIVRRALPEDAEETAAKGIAVKTMPDERWHRVDIKTVMLLPSVLAHQAAHEDGAGDAWLVDGEGFVTEGASSNAWIVDDEGRLITRPADSGILRGVTRSVVIDLAAREGLTLIERAFTVEEARGAREAFKTSATGMVMPVVSIDGRPIANGHPGHFATQLRKLFHTQAEMVL